MKVPTGKHLFQSSNTNGIIIIATKLSKESLQLQTQMSNIESINQKGYLKRKSVKLNPIPKTKIIVTKIESPKIKRERERERERGVPESRE